VGYGKTEVATRAAFKVAQEGKQVAILVPTTVLAQQHFQTFADRLAPYPVRVDVLSRFRTPGESRKVIEDVRLGAIDILVGTHRLLQPDLEFHDLGLVIVDEEQRFGVMQKERLKEMRREVDIMTLSATPIPRTLQFALGGMREISLINDPPRGRMPVRTYVGPYRDEQTRVAIERELERDGQVYYVHNRIGSIYHVAEKLRQLVPRARIVVGHGQMNEDELEQVMLDFLHRRADVLLATTIIENGLDLPNANTIIVDRAELLGLSQMYQLRGRVGRSNRQAYAYFFSGSRGKLSETSEERFAAIQEYADLGAGFKIAMRDLEIRGAGDVLGVKQSGSISSVGFELYTEMLREAVAGLRHEPIVKREELPEADLPVPAFLPEEYVPQERDRLGLYRKMSNIGDEDDIQSLQEELRDRFGPLPAPAFNLIRVLRVRLNLLHSRLRGISKNETEALIRLKPGDRFPDEDVAAVHGRLNKLTDKRLKQHVALKPLDGFAIDTRALTALQVLRLSEEIVESLAVVRAPRLHGGDLAREARKKRKEEAKAEHIDGVAS
jgi:transcription-repair coupling factor (superfamily II helicase)